MYQYDFTPFSLLQFLVAGLLLMLRILNHLILFFSITHQLMCGHRSCFDDACPALTNSYYYFAIHYAHIVRDNLGYQYCLQRMAARAYLAYEE